MIILKRGKQIMQSLYISNTYRIYILIAGIYDVLVGLSGFFLYGITYLLMSALDPNLPMAPEQSMEMTWLKMNGVFMIFIGLGYIFPYLNYERHKSYIIVFGVGLRTWGGIFLVYAGIAWKLSFILTIFGIIDLLFAVGFVFFINNYKRRKVMLT